MSDRKPNFFIIGAPKCGTTSLSSWLREHPNIYLTTPKEPQFFNTDHMVPWRHGSIEEYETLYVGAMDQHRAVGEASTAYLRSNAALPSILLHYPEAKFIVCLRNPLEMVVSMHAQLVKMGIENVTSFESAWKLQSSRREGNDIPFTCLDSTALQYGSNCMLGRQVQRLLGLVLRENVLFLYLEDIKTDPRLEYSRVLRFLDLQDDDREDFPVENQRATPRYIWLSRILRIAALIKARVGMRRGLGIGERLSRFNNDGARRERLSTEMTATLHDYYKADMSLLSRLTDRELQHWHPSSGEN